MTDTITLLWHRGIGEPIGGPHTMGAEVAKHLPTNWKLVEVPWPADYGPVGSSGIHGDSYAQNLLRGQAITLDLMAHTTGPVVLGGYSGGAALAGGVAAEIGNQLGPNGITVGALLIADPNMPEGLDPRGWYGVAGSRPLGKVRGWWAWSHRDPICCCPPISPLRTMADQSGSMSFGDPRAWGQDLIARTKERRFQPSAWDWRDLRGTFHRIGEAVRMVGDYGRFHFTDYLGERVQDTVARMVLDLSPKGRW